jgi:class 3 adenylate cyclase
VVNRCARIRSTADPGQILLSSATAALIEGSLPDGAKLRSLGTRQLKDIADPEQVWELALVSPDSARGS